LANTIKLEIVSPQKVVYSTDVNMLIVKSTAGELGFLPNHAPLVAGLMPAPMRLLTDGGEELVSVSGGFVEVQPKKITVLAANAELASEIDVDRARRAYDRAKERLSKGDIDVARAEAALSRAKARLRTAKQEI
jgi:F-type H+-transporting ATPase subunit epsilon